MYRNDAIGGATDTGVTAVGIVDGISNNIDGGGLFSATACHNRCVTPLIHRVHRQKLRWAMYTYTCILYIALQSLALILIMLVTRIKTYNDNGFPFWERIYYIIYYTLCMHVWCSLPWTAHIDTKSAHTLTIAYTGKTGAVFVLAKNDICHYAESGTIYKLSWKNSAI